MRSPHVLVLPSFYPMELDFPRGNFFHEQARMLVDAGVNLAVLFAERRSITSLSWARLKVAHFQKSWSVENGVPTLRKKTWNIIPTKFEQGENIWIKQTIQLVEDYIKEKGRPDVVHAHCIVSAGIVANRIWNKYKIPFILTEHSTRFGTGTFQKKKAAFYREVISNAKKVIVVSTPFKKLLSQTLGVAPDKISVIPNFIDVDYFKPSGKKNVTSSGLRTIFCLCYHENKKRLDRLVEAVAELRSRGEKVKLVLGGEGPTSASLKQLVDSLKLDEVVDFKGFMSPEQLRSQLLATDVFVLPSDVETFGVVLIEAMAMGVPVVATRSGGPEDIVTETTGMLVDKNVKSVAEGVLYVLKNQQKFDSRMIRDHVIENFSSKRNTASYIDMYHEALFSSAKSVTVN